MNTVLLPMLLPAWLNPTYILQHLGVWALWGVVAIVIVECGLFCFFLPGDSLLFAVGMLVAGLLLGTDGAAITIHFGDLSKGWVLVLVCAILSVAAILGNTLGYWIGRLVGPPLLRPRTGLAGKILKQEYADKSREFFESRGHIALVLARFVPVVRTFVTLVAGISKMSFATFIGYSAIGGILWGSGVTILGYFLGRVGFIQKHIEVALVLIVLVSFIPVVVETINQRRAAKA